MPLSLGKILLVYLTVLTALIASITPVLPVQAQDVWREADPVRVLIDSTADWGRILFDDLNGTNSNGIRIVSAEDSGWNVGKGPNYVLDVGPKIPWPDQEYDSIVVRKGDMVGFFKGLQNFNYSEAYADLILDVDTSLPQIYVWLMGGGNGTTTFEILSKTTGGTIWRDVIVGNGVTQQVKRLMTPQPFFHAGRSESGVVEAWLSAAVVIIVLLNFPLIEALAVYVRKRRSSNSTRRERDKAVE